MVKIYSDLAIRELVANAIVHQDFSIQGTSSMVEIFNNRIEITNPGKPLIDPLRFIDHSPVSRNEILARFMRRLNICEERGSGIDKFVSECEFYQLPDLHACLKYVSGELMTNQSLRERLGIEEKNYPMVSRIISDAKEAVLIKDADRDKSRVYVPYWA